MTEAEWLSSTDERAMLHFILWKARPSHRKLRLYGCACCRLVWPLLQDERSRRAVEVAEAFADGKAKLKQARPGAEAAYRDRGMQAVFSEATNSAASAANEVVGQFPIGAAHWGASGVRSALSAWLRESPTANAADPTRLTHLYRDVVGNPYRPATIEVAWRTPAVLSLAQAAYDERLLPSGELDPPRLAVLADALEEAGCASADLLGHLRSPGPHVRGCWAVDLCLGKS
jgi:hypothetical protein